ncbi:hypothetical protein DVH24_004128 [Malus domestica]|uniref:VOC domain-containing protein n=1 Tax=Malus domestica TaxID=3750 RepID=A0A498K7W1_MALDO|nr:hypothetical protein DVH24_004128 [Malus domestica]
MVIKYEQLVCAILLFLSLFVARAVPHDDVLEWIQKDNHRFLRANIRVGDLDRTIKFYTEFFGMKVLSRKDFPAEKYSNAIVGFGPEESQFVIGLTDHHNAEDELDIGTAFSHFGFSTQDIYNTVEKVRASGGVITRESGPLVEGGEGTVFAFMNDPDGYSFELLQRPPTPQPLSHICLNVLDLDRSIEFYNKYTVGMVGYGSNLTQTVVIELKYNYNVTAYRRGNGYAQVAIGTNDVYKSAAAVRRVTKEVGGEIIIPPGPIPKIDAKITALLDTDGFQTVLVDNEDYLKRIEEREMKQNP